MTFSFFVKKFVRYKNVSYIAEDFQNKYIMIYQVIKESADSNSIVKELNAMVFSSTFKEKKGVQKADLYTYEGTLCRNPKEIVAHGTCAPALGVFVETIDINF
jgi:hypothetical protein